MGEVGYDALADEAAPVTLAGWAARPAPARPESRRLRRARRRGVR